jgi:hypothetical protein
VLNVYAFSSVKDDQIYLAVEQIIREIKEPHLYLRSNNVSVD